MALSRQRKWQLARIAEGKCQQCGARRICRFSVRFCLTCLKVRRVNSLAGYHRRRKLVLTLDDAPG